MHRRDNTRKQIQQILEKMGMDTILIETIKFWIAE